MATARRAPAMLAAYVLHQYNWSETSLIVDLFTREQGRLVVVAKGAKRPYSQLRPVLLPFQRILVAVGRVARSTPSEDNTPEVQTLRCPNRVAPQWWMASRVTQASQRGLSCSPLPRTIDSRCPWLVHARTAPEQHQATHMHPARQQVLRGRLSSSSKGTRPACVSARGSWWFDLVARRRATGMAAPAPARRARMLGLDPPAYDSLRFCPRTVR